MHQPTIFEQGDPDTIKSLVRENPLGTWVVIQDGIPVANHLPFLLNDEGPGFGVLCGHLARANPVWKNFDENGESLIIFQGMQGYVTPSWYPSKKAHGKVVPTWNYSVVHVRGKASLQHNRDWLFEHVKQQTELREHGRTPPWALADAPRDYIDKMVGAIVGVEIVVESVVGKWKMSQNKSDADQQGVVEGLRKQGDDQSVKMAEFISSE